MLQFVDVLAGNEVGPRAQQLPELDERRTHLLQRQAQPHRTAVPFRSPLDTQRHRLLPKAHQDPGTERLGHLHQAILHQDGHDVPITPQPLQTALEMQPPHRR